MSVTVPDADTMTRLGQRMGAHLRAGDALCLSGPLGAGKTTLTRGIAVGLGSPAAVSSPTFVISRRYRGGRVDLVHCDAYRLSPDDDFVDVVPDPESVVTVVEWGGGVMAAIADSWLEVDIVRPTGEGDDVRTVTFRAVGSEWDDERMVLLTGDS